MTLCVVDAGIAVRWVVQLPLHEEACALLGSGNPLAAPDFLQAEVGSVLARLVRGKVLTPADGTEAFDDFFRAPIRLLPVRPVAPQALKIALKHGQGFYDCLYLALAESRNGLFATADKRFWNAMKATPHAKHIMLIGGTTVATGEN